MKRFGMKSESLHTNLVVVAATVFFMAPLLAPVIISFSDTDFIQFPPQGFSLRWYLKILSDGEFLSAAYLSLKLACIAAIVSGVLGTLAALGINRLPSGMLVQPFIMSPLVFPVLVTGIALLQFFTAIRSQSTMTHLIIGHVIITLPFVVRTVTASVMQCEKALEEAAYTLGADAWRCFFHVVFPQIKNGVIVGCLFAFIISFDNYPLSMWLADAEHTPLPMAIYRYIQRFFDPTVAAISGITIAGSVIVLLVMERFGGTRKMVQ